LPPPLEVAGPRRAHGNELVHNSLSLQKRLKAGVEEKRDFRIGEGLTKIAQKRNEHGEITQIPELDYEDARGWFGEICNRLKRGDQWLHKLRHGFEHANE